MAFVEKSISDIQRLVGGRFVFLVLVSSEPGLIEFIVAWDTESLA